VDEDDGTIVSGHGRDPFHEWGRVLGDDFVAGGPTASVT
jgi:hypothetical protein